MKNIILYASLLLGFLVACQSVDVPHATVDSEVALFSDVDIDQAILVNFNDPRQLLGKDTHEVQDGDILADPGENPLPNEDDLSTEAVISGATGYIVYLQYDPSLTRPYRVYGHDQASNVRELIYQGKREIQSLGYGSGTLALSMRQSHNGAQDFEIFLLDLSASTVDRITSNNVDDTNVSLSGSGQIVAWEYPKNAKPTLAIRTYENSSFTDVILSNSRPQRQASLARNGSQLVFVRELSNGKDRVLSYDLGASAYTTIYTSSNMLEHPSVSESGNEVMWLQQSSTSRARVKTLSTGTIQTVASNSNGIEHPYITSDGKYMTYGQLRNGGFNVYTKNIETGVTKRLSNASSPRNHLAMVWEKSGSALFVSNTNDSGSGSLRRALQDANSGDVISFDPTIFSTAKTINLDSQLELDKSVTLRGAGQNIVTLRGRNQRIFRISVGVHVTLTDLTLRAGKAHDNAGSGNSGRLGGAIFNDGTLSLENIMLLDNEADSGGAIYNNNNANLEISNSLIQNNIDSVRGAALFNKGTADLKDTTLDSNHVDHAGGAIYNADGGNVSLRDSYVTNNSSNKFAAGILNDGVLEVRNTNITGNTADADTTSNDREDGGGILSSGHATVISSIIDSNDNAHAGGGITIWDGSFTLRSSTVSNHRVRGWGAGIYVQGANSSLIIENSRILSNEATNQHGGGIYLAEGNLTITNSTLKGNSAGINGGGIYAKTSFSLTGNSSVIENVATQSGGGIYSEDSATIQDSQINENEADTAHGGGIFSSGFLNLTDSTVSGNRATGAGQMGGGIYTSATFSAIGSTIKANNALLGGGIYVLSDTTTLDSTTVGGTQTNDANTAFIGGGIYSKGTLTIQSNSAVIGNGAGEGGGGIVNEGGTLNNSGNVANNVPEDIVNFP